MNIKSIEQVEIEGRLLFIRTDYDYGLNANSEKINFKIDYSLPTVKYAVENGARVVIASSRRVKEHKHNPEYSLRLAGDMLSRELNTNIYFPEDCIGDAVKKIKQDMNPGDVMLLENLMFYKHETDNNPRFCKKLAESIEVYVSEAFGL
ncbi:MAG: phosphoglycerate kinase, partial [Candidatus Dadabacteria bacterium]|nr:phosphoglycerate kinase [Candidatus Dadabacteria bacterium]